MATEWKDTDGAIANVIAVNSRGGTRYSVVFTYKVNGSWYGGTFHTGTPYRKGDTLPVQYDPSNPDRNSYVEHEKRMHWVYAAILAFFAVIAILYLLHPPSR